METDSCAVKLLEEYKTFDEIWYDTDYSQAQHICKQIDD